MPRWLYALVELLGFSLLLWFAYLVWPPLVLAGAGSLLVLWSNIRGVAAARRPPDGQ